MNKLSSYLTQPARNSAIGKNKSADYGMRAHLPSSLLQQEMRLRILTFLLRSCAFDYETYPDFKEQFGTFIRCLSAISHGDATVWRWLQHYYSRFTPWGLFCEPAFADELDNAWWTLGGVCSAKDALGQLYGIAAPIGLPEQKVLEHIFEHPWPDFDALNRHSEWSTAMTATSILTAGLQLLTEQVTFEWAYAFDTAEAVGNDISSFADRSELTRLDIPSTLDIGLY